MEGRVAMIDLPYSKEIASTILTMSLFSVIFNLYVLGSVYKKRILRNSCTAIIVCNLACVDILVTLKDIPSFMTVISTNKWRFEDTWCASYGLTSVIFIIVSVSTLVTVSSERFSRLREMALRGAGNEHTAQHPLILGYVIAQTTLSYSLSLLWSKYIFVSRKAFCRVEFQSQYGFSMTFLSSFVFIIPVSALVYNVLYKSFLKDTEKTGSNQLLEDKKSDPVSEFERRAQQQIHIAVAIFLCSWTPYVIESLLSSNYQIPPNIGIIVACIPMFSTSLLPLFYISYSFSNDTKVTQLKVVIQ